MKSALRHYVILLAAAALLAAPAVADTTIGLSKIGQYPMPADPAAFDEGAAEIVVYDAASGRAFVVNSQDATVDILDLSTPSMPTLVDRIDATNLGDGANSVAVHDGLVAVAIENADSQMPGTLAFYDVDGNFLNAVTVGPLPDMVTFTPNGRYALVANEGEPNDDYTVDPEGSISIVPTFGNVARLDDGDVRTAGFAAFNGAVLDDGIRIFGPNATVAQDLEPEYITVSNDSRTAHVACQENNALAVVDIDSATVTALVGLGFKDHSVAGNELDASNRDGGIVIRRWPVLGMYQPDAIASYAVGGETFIVSANEGDARDYDGYSEEERVKDLVLDPTAYPDAAELQLDENLGRLNSTNANGDVDGDGDVDQIYVYGARSVSVWNASGELVWDSGATLENVTAAILPNDFNSTNDENGSFDNRSDDKGPEPEGVVLGKVAGKTYAFVGLERVGGIAVFDVSDPTDGRFVTYLTSRDFGGDAAAATAGDLAPEGLAFVSEEDSPTGTPLLLVGHEVSGTTAVFEISIEGRPADR